MAKLDFPAASASPFLAPNGVTYTYIGTEPTGHWSGTEADGSISLESKFVEITGDDMSGDLTLGTNKIKLDATTGAASFSGDTVFGTYPDQGMTLTNTGVIIAERKDRNVHTYLNRASTPVVGGAASVPIGFSTGTYNGDTKIFNSEILANGEASFAGGKYTIASNGALNIYSDPTDTTQEFSSLSSYGRLVLSRTDNTKAAIEISPSDTAPGNSTVLINSNGSAQFAGSVEALQFTVPRDTDNATIGGFGTVAGTTHVKLAAFGGIADVLIGNDASGNYTTFAPDGSATFAGGKFFINNAGNVYLGTNGNLDTISSNRKISLAASGSATFASNGIFGGTVSAGPNVVAATTRYTSIGTGFDIGAASNNVFAHYDTGNNIYAKIQNDGSAMFKGAVQVGGGVVTPSAVLQLEADDDTKYTSTTDADGNVTLVYNGETLDVKDRLQKADVALKALKVAAAAASDFATLKSAIATALYDI